MMVKKSKKSEPAFIKDIVKKYGHVISTGNEILDQSYYGSANSRQLSKRRETYYLSRRRGATQRNESFGSRGS